MKMILIFIGLFSVLLQAPMVPAKEYHLDFTTLCSLYPDFTHGNTALELGFSNSMRLAISDLIGDLEEQGLPFENLKSHCSSISSKYLKPECLFLKRFQILAENDDLEDLMLDQDNDLVKIYKDLWLLHPAMRGCAKQLNKPAGKNDAKARLLKGLLGKNVGKYAVIFQDNWYDESTVIKRDIVKLCGKKDADKIFCPGLLEIIRLVDTYQAVKHASRNGGKWNAYRLHFAMIRHNHPGQYTSAISEQTANDIIFKNMEQFLTYTNYRDKAGINEMFRVMPGKSRGTSCGDLSNIPSSSKKIVCIFWKTVNLIRTYLKSTAPMKNGPVKVILNTNIDYPTFLRWNEMTRIISAVQNQNKVMTKLAGWVIREVKKDVNERFKGLRSYFQKVAKFSRDISQADIDFIKGRLDFYKMDVTALSNELSTKLAKIMKYAFVSVSAEIAENAVQVALAGAVVANPLEKLFGGGSVGDFMDRTAALANSLTNIAELVRASKTFGEVRTRTNSISKKFKKNDDFLENLNTLILGVGKEQNLQAFDSQRKTFLKNYVDYDPQVKRPELTAMTTTYGNLIDACCDVIMDTETAAAAAVKGTVKSSGLCPKTKEVAEKMFETFAEIYDFQFDLIDAMADFMKAANSHHAAQGIADDYDKLSNSQGQDIVNELKIMSVYAFISYKINIWDISDAYCHILTYKEGGRPPSVCRQRERDIATIASYSNPIVCRGRQGIKDVPISSKSDQGFMDLSDLYAGRDVTFKIPNSKWLVDNNWISIKDKDSAIVVKKFEVFLPTNSSTIRYVRVNAKATVENKLSISSNTNYVIVPNREFIYEYVEGVGSEQSCRHASQVLINPYGPSLPKLCTLNVDENNCKELLQKTALFPSIYSRWKITVTGYESTPVPTPANDDFKLKVSVKLCILSPRNDDQGIEKKRKVMKKRPQKVKSKLKDQERQSCPNSQYWSKKLGRCVYCPKGSRSALDRYFCEKIPKMNGD